MSTRHHAVDAMPPAALRVAVFLVLVITIGILAAMSTDHVRIQPGAKPATPALFLEDTSPQPLVPTVEAFEQTVKANGWSILGVTDMAGILSARGFTIAPVLVFDACSGKYSADLLGKDETRFVASMIPCRVAIYQTRSGEVVISRMDSVAMAEMVGGQAGAVIKSSGEEMERIIRATLKKLAA